MTRRNVKQWSDDHGEEGDDAPCSFWQRAVRGTRDEEGVPAYCADPAHCEAHWEVQVKVMPPSVACPGCGAISKMNAGYGQLAYMFDDHHNCIVAHPQALCDECERTHEE